MRAAVNTFKGHKEEISCVDLSPDRKMIVSGSLDGTLRFWDTMMQRMIKSIKVGSTGYPICAVYNP
jgi:WD40 repeat protein